MLTRQEWLIGIGVGIVAALLAGHGGSMPQLVRQPELPTFNQYRHTLRLALKWGPLPGPRECWHLRVPLLAAGPEWEAKHASDYGVVVAQFKKACLMRPR